MSGSRGNNLALPLAFALIAGAFAVWLVHDQVDKATARGGPPVTVFVAIQPITAATPIDVDEIDALVAERTIPRDYAPIDALSEREELIDSTLVASIDTGAVLTRPLLAAPGDATEYALRAGERAVSVAVRSAPDGTVLVAGDRVDLIASGFDGAASSELVLAGAQVLSASESETRPGSQRLTLRVAADQSTALVRADVFARELRAIEINARSR